MKKIWGFFFVIWKYENKFYVYYVYFFKICNNKKKKKYLVLLLGNIFFGL